MRAVVNVAFSVSHILFCIILNYLFDYDFCNCTLAIIIKKGVSLN